MHLHCSQKSTERNGDYLQFNIYPILLAFLQLTMTDLNPTRHWWSWRSCFAAVKYTKKKSRKTINYQSNTFSNGHTDTKRLLPATSNAKILSEFGLQTSNAVSNDDNLKAKNEKTSYQSAQMQQLVDSLNMKMFSLKSSSTVKPTPLDAIVEDSSEENLDEIDEFEQSDSLCNDRDLVNDATVLHTRLFDLSKMSHIITQFDDNGYFLGEFTHQLHKFKLKIDAIRLVNARTPRDPELLEAKYSTLLATIECLSVLLKVAQISSSRSLINRLMFSLEERIEQLNKLVQLSLSINIYPKQQDLIDDDLPSFRSALSSYEQLTTLS
ncbi:unnamed protein product [Adineta ricciae]|uniref:Uncharacterized protein n=1 Tax=Adineta ricciae TaxID=249248 RepID=A0A813MLE6_ADIRI|nr:unnamed protein product [Adineta ricciae]